MILSSALGAAVSPASVAVSVAASGVVSGASLGAVSAWALGLPSFAALIGYACAAWLETGAGGRFRLALSLAWVAHLVAIVVDVAGIGSNVIAARFGFAPALSMTVWLVLAVYLIESRFVPLPGARRVLAGLGIVVILLAWLFPGEVRPQVVSRWAPLH